MRILFVGKSWSGSSSRSLREALSRIATVEIDDLSEDLYLPKATGRLLRSINRILAPLQRRELERDLLQKLEGARPHVLMVYKGNDISRSVISRAKQLGVLTINVFPDCTPHAHGGALLDAIGAYDLVISTKPFHPPNWSTIYQCTNPCVCVPHGFDPAVHQWDDPPLSQDIDLALAATWRSEYHELMRGVAHGLDGMSARVAVMGHGWSQHARDFPAHWEFKPAALGRPYGEWLRRSRIALAPVTRNIVIGGVRQPGDEDTTRTYELAAMRCFFLHQRTPFVQTLYDEATEVPMWNDAGEIVTLVRHYLPREEERKRMADRAHARAVPAYSIPMRAAEVLRHVEVALAQRGLEDSDGG